MSGVHGRRMVGRLRPPSREQLAGYASRLQLELADGEVDGELARVGELLPALDLLEELPVPRIPLRHPHRDPGWAPTAEEDPGNAVIRFCDVRGAETGPLAGLRVGVKDCIAVAGVPMTAGSRRVPVHVPLEDAVVVERLLDAGARITAKTNLPDLALGMSEGSAFGATRNPRNPRFSAGGSSSGSAAAVASGLVDVALGADEGGSVRIPAAWCGLVGMKATHGLVPSYGLLYYDHTLDHIGPITATVEQNAALLRVIAGSDWRDPQWVRADPAPEDYAAAAGIGVAGLRVGVLTDSLAAATPDTAAAFEAAVAVLEDLGAVPVPVSVPLWGSAIPVFLGCLGVALTSMVQSLGQGHGHLGRIDTTLMATTAAQLRLGSAELPPTLRTMVLAVEHLRSAYLGEPLGLAQNLRLELRRQVTALFTDVDVVVTPTTPTRPFLLQDEPPADGVLDVGGTLAPLNTAPLDLTGHPAISVPCGVDADDLPYALQIVGPAFGEALLYRVAFAFEAAVDG